MSLHDIIYVATLLFQQMLKEGQQRGKNLNAELRELQNTLTTTEVATCYSRWCNHYVCVTEYLESVYVYVQHCAILVFGGGLECRYVSLYKCVECKGQV